tara:strand:- start:18 stop:644 length:627 start_codon:yes stop_codon:yes gene_type:complete
MAINALQYGLAALAGTAANVYFNPQHHNLQQHSPNAPVTSTSFSGTGGNAISNFLGTTMNTLGITPSQTMHSLPGFVQTGISNLMSGKGLLGTGMGMDMSQGDMFEGMTSFPSAGRVNPTSIRSDTNFGVSSANLVPIGRNGRVSRALSKPNVQQYIAKSVRGIKVPGRILAGQTAVGSSTLGKMSVKRSATRTPTYTKNTATPTGKV